MYHIINTMQDTYTTSVTSPSLAPHPPNFSDVCLLGLCTDLLDFKILILQALHVEIYLASRLSVPFVGLDLDTQFLGPNIGDGRL